ncbi:MAG TPA: SHOCT domain-containing protein [Coriobacteriia bacterium]|nr:SHOCT domain-containing protein [Coriobacteriia bacterium]
MMWDGASGYTGLGSWIGIGFMMLFGLLVLAGLTLLVIWLARSGQIGHTQGDAGTQAACDIAKQRYARGEISREQLDEICRTVGR